MQDDVTWKLSLLMDDELSSDEAIALLEQIQRDPQLQLKWYQYQLIRQALRSGNGIQSQPDFLARVQVALASEPAPDQPALIQEPAKQRIPLNRWIVIPVALAAAVLIVVLMLNRQSEPAFKTPPLAKAASFRADQTDPGNRGAVLSPHHFTQIEDYLLAHSEDSLYLPGSQHMLSYARIVTHGSR